jgi:hypothetical protein
MKKISIAVTAFLAASSVYAAGTSVCAAPTAAGDGTQITSALGYAGTASGFVINSFTPKCSANVFAAFEQTEIAAAVAAGSKKGKNLFAGSTNGGGVKNVNTTPYANGLTTGDTTGGTADVLAAGGGGST